MQVGAAANPVATPVATPEPAADSPPAASTPASAPASAPTSAPTSTPAAAPAGEGSAAPRSIFNSLTGQPLAPGGSLASLPPPDFRLNDLASPSPDAPWQYPLDRGPHIQYAKSAADPAAPASATTPTTPTTPTAPTTAPEAAAPAATAHPAGPKADPMEVAALEMLLADPANQDMVKHFGGELKPLPTWTSNGQGIEARYGADLGGRLYQLQQSQRAVEGEFFQALDKAQQNPPEARALISRPGQPEPTTELPGWRYERGSGHWEGDPPSWKFDPVSFATQYAAGDSPAQRAFASLHGSEPVKFVRAPDTETAGPDGWQMSGLSLRMGRPVDREEGLTPESLHAKDGWVSSGALRPDHLLDPNRITKLINKEAVWFDPVHGFSTDPDNLKPDALDRAMPYVFAAAVTAMTFGAGSTVAAGIASAAGEGAAGSIAVGAAMGAVSNSALQLAANGKINFGQLLQSAVAGGLTAGMTQLPGVGEYLDASGKGFGGRLMAYTGRATVQGAMQAVMGGKFGDGFASGLMSGLAGEVTAQLDAHIDQMRGLSASEAGALRLLTRATGSAMRLVGSNDPAAGFASDFLGGIMQDGLASHRPLGADEPSGHASPATPPNAGSAGEPGLGTNPVTSATLTVSSGDTLERLARQQYGENWRAGLTAMIGSNPELTSNRWGSPIIQPGQTLNAPSLQGLGADQLAQLGRVGGQLIAGNSQGLAARDAWLAQQAAARERAAQQAVAQNRNSGTMTQQEAHDRYMAAGGRSGGNASEMGDAYVPTWGGGGAPSITQAQSLGSAESVAESDWTSGNGPEDRVVGREEDPNFIDVASLNGAPLARLAARGLALMSAEMASYGYRLVAPEVYFLPDAPGAKPIRIDGAFSGPDGRVVFGEAKIGDHADFTANQRNGVDALREGKGTFYGSSANDLANRLGIKPDANGRFHIPADKIQGVYAATYERNRPPSSRMQNLNESFRRMGGFTRGSDI